MQLIKLQQALLFSTLIITSSLAGCFGNDEENSEASNYENDITEKDKEIENLEAVIANLTMNITDLTEEKVSLEEQYSSLMMNYNLSILHSENLSSQLIYCAYNFGITEPPTCLDAQGWYAEYMIREEAEQNLSYALEYVEWMESHLVVHLIGANLSGAELVGADLSDSIILDSNLSGADLSWSWLNGSNLSGTDFSYAQLDGVNFGYGANITNVSFRGANLELVYFHRSISFNGVDFSDTAIGYNFELIIQPWFYNVNFSGSVFYGSDTIVGSSFESVDLTFSHGLAFVANGAYFENSDLTGATYAVPYNSYWINTICPDGSNSDNNGNTCEGHEI